MLKRKKLLSILGFIVIGLCISACKPKTEQTEPKTVSAETVSDTEVQKNDEEDLKSEEKGTAQDEGEDEQKPLIEENDQPEDPADIEDGDERLEAFFSDSVLTGDSISKHFGNFITKNKGALPGKMMFLSEGSFSLHNAKEEPKPDSTFPLYKGEKMKIEDAIALMGVHNVFMFYGINDLGRGTPETCLELYDDQIDRIIEKTPDANIFIISPTYLHKDKASSYKKLNNKNIKKFNDMLIDYCDTTQKAVYIDLATKLQDEDGNLKAEYCNDNYCHHTEKAFEIWIEVLMDQAKMEVIKK